MISPTANSTGVSAPTSAIPFIIPSPDHEGDYGYRIAWTPALFDAFTRRTGYDLHKVLPLLIYEGGDSTIKVRCDYLATVTQLYHDSFWKGITDHAAKLGIGRTGHAWEESLQWAAALEGSLFAVERGLNPVGVDSLFDLWPPAPELQGRPIRRGLRRAAFHV